jgi:pimeloyl-ACP methyl ester carboxylesterase
MDATDWGARSTRWSGIHGTSIEVDGTTTYLLRADSLSADGEAHVHVLLHGVAGTGLFLLDVVGPLRRLGAVVAPDLPGSIFGRTETRTTADARIDANARFVRALLDTMGLDQVILHGFSAGAAAAMRVAAWYPERVAGLVLASPPLPVPLTRADAVTLHWLARPVLAAAPVLASPLLGLAGHHLIRRKMAYLFSAEEIPSAYAGLGLDLTRISADTRALWREEVALIQPSRLRHAVTAFASVLSSILTDQRGTWMTIDEIRQPVLVVWGERDPLLERPALDRVLARRPDWGLHIIHERGHGAFVEDPDDYASAVEGWLKARSLGA